MTVTEADALRNEIAKRACHALAKDLMTALCATGMPVAECQRIAADFSARANRTVLAALWEIAVAVTTKKRRRKP